MASFPTLKTGAVAQYPAQRSIAYATTVMRFLDGSEQRYRQLGSPERTWVIRLDLLDDAEMVALEEFLNGQGGEQYDFAFTDPWDGAVYDSCRLIAPETEFAHLSEARGRTAFVVRENRQS